jgi:hypothetical protein
MEMMKISSIIWPPGTHPCYTNNKINNNGKRLLPPPITPRSAKKIKITSFDEHERLTLENFFQHTPYPFSADYDQLAVHLRRDREKIRTWFKNHRMRVGMVKQNHQKIIFSPQEEETLLNLFQTDSRPLPQVRKNIALQLGKRVNEISRWFSIHRKRLGMRRKVLFNYQDKKIMKNLLKKNPYPRLTEYQELSCKLGKTVKQIRGWVNNDRRKNKLY